jgi:hypothetical protein
MKFKTNLQPQTQSQMLKKILSLKSFSDKTELYHHSIITMRQFEFADDKIAGCLENDIDEFSKTSFNTVLNKISKSKDLSKIAKTGINLNCFRFIRESLTEDDLTFMQGKYKKNITVDELQYYLFRITKKVFEGGGYTSDARNYYTSNGFKTEYKVKTNRAINKEKIAEMNKVLNKYDWINIYQKKKTPNLFVMGKQNPFYYMEGIMEPETIKEIQQIIDGKELFSVKQTQTDKKLKDLKLQLKEADTTIAKLNKEVEKLKKQTPDTADMQAEIDCLIERNQELLDENLKYHQQYDENVLNINNKPVVRSDTFGSDSADLIAGKKKGSISENVVVSGKELFKEAIGSISKMTG